VFLPVICMSAIRRHCTGFVIWLRGISETKIKSFTRSRDFGGMQPASYSLCVCALGSTERPKCNKEKLLPQHQFAVSSLSSPPSRYSLRQRSLNNKVGYSSIVTPNARHEAVSTTEKAAEVSYTDRGYEGAEGTPMVRQCNLK
jgi:hypothetical protein